MPAERPLVFTETPSVVGVVWTVEGLTESQALPDPGAAVNEMGTAAPALLVTDRFCAAGGVPGLAYVNVSEAGACSAGGPVTVSVTGMFCGLFVTPDAVTVNWPE